MNGRQESRVTFLSAVRPCKSKIGHCDPLTILTEAKLQNQNLLKGKVGIHGMVGSQSLGLTVAAQSFLGSRGGISQLCDLTARVAFEAGYPLSLLSVQSEGGSFHDYDFWQGCGGSRIKFVIACGRAALHGDHIFYDQLGTARAHIWPSRVARPCGVWIHGIEVWDQLRPDRLRAAHRVAFMWANTHFTRLRAIKHDKVFEFGAGMLACHLGGRASSGERPP